MCMLGCFAAGLALAADTNSEIEKDKPETLNPDLGNASLRSYVKEETSEKQANGAENKTWLNNLVNTVAEKGAQVISSTSNNANMYRTNASVFDISGVMLRMNTKEVEAAIITTAAAKSFFISRNFFTFLPLLILRCRRN